MSDTTTELNLGDGGDLMDESLVLQSDEATQAKRPRVVIGGDAGYDTASDENDLVQPVNVDPGQGAHGLPTIPLALVGDVSPTGYVSGELRPLSVTSDGRVRTTVVEANVFLDFFGEARPIRLSERNCTWLPDGGAHPRGGL